MRRRHTKFGNEIDVMSPERESERNHFENNQPFSRVLLGDSTESGAHLIVNKNSNQCLDIYSHDNFEGSPLEQYDCDGSGEDNQRWKVDPSLGTIARYAIEEVVGFHTHTRHINIHSHIRSRPIFLACLPSVATKPARPQVPSLWSPFALPPRCRHQHTSYAVSPSSSFLSSFNSLSACTTQDAKRCVES